MPREPEALQDRTADSKFNGEPGHQEYSAAASKLSAKGPASDHDAPLLQRTAFLESIVGFSSENLKASRVTVKQKQRLQGASVLIAVRDVKDDEEPSLVFLEQFETTTAAAGKTSGSSSTEVAAAEDASDSSSADAVAALETAKANHAVRRSEPQQSLPVQPPESPVATPTSSPQVPTKRASESNTGPLTKAQRREKALKLKPKPAVRTEHYSKKPLYRTMCLDEISNKCDRTGCNLVHGDQVEYFESPEYVTDGRPWQKVNPKIEGGFDDLPYPPTVSKRWSRTEQKFCYTL